MKYKLDFSKKAEKQLEKLDIYHQRLISNWLELNIRDTENPRNHGKPLTESLSGFWCYRVGNYRIVCEIRDSELVVIAINIGHRREVYR